MGVDAGGEGRRFAAGRRAADFFDGPVGMLRPLGTPRPAQVVAAPDGTPRAVVVDGRRRAVAAVRDDWLVQDRWWTDRPIDRHYFELVLEPGTVAVAYRDGADGAWHIHR